MAKSHGFQISPKKEVDVEQNSDQILNSLLQGYSNFVQQLSKARGNSFIV